MPLGAGLYCAAAIGAGLCCAVALGAGLTLQNIVVLPSSQGPGIFTVNV
jgi:hypothetical protein